MCYDSSMVSTHTQISYIYSVASTLVPNLRINTPTLKEKDVNVSIDNCRDVLLPVGVKINFPLIFILCIYRKRNQTDNLNSNNPSNWTFELDDDFVIGCNNKSLDLILPTIIWSGNAHRITRTSISFAKDNSNCTKDNLEAIATISYPVSRYS